MSSLDWSGSGRTWQKPLLHMYPIGGSIANNVIGPMKASATSFILNLAVTFAIRWAIRLHSDANSNHAANAAPVCRLRNLPVIFARRLPIRFPLEAHSTHASKAPETARLRNFPVTFVSRCAILFRSEANSSHASKAFEMARLRTFPTTCRSSLLNTVHCEKG